jgi:hypothetical protein
MTGVAPTGVETAMRRRKDGRQYLPPWNAVPGP